MAGQLKVIVDKNYLTNQIASAINKVKTQPIQITIKIEDSALTNLENRLKALNNGSVDIKPLPEGSGSSSKNSNTKTPNFDINAERKKLQNLIKEQEDTLKSITDLPKFKEAVGNKSPTTLAMSSEISSVRDDLKQIGTELEKVDSADGLEKLQSSFDKLTPKVKSLTSASKDLDDSFLSNQKWAKTAVSIEKAQRNVEAFLSKNSALKSNQGLLDEYNQLKALSGTLQTGKDLTQFNAQWSAYTAKVKEAGLAHKSFSDSLKGAFNVVSRYFSANQIVTKLTSEIKKAVTDLKEYDTILTEISKTSELTDSELKSVLQNSYGTANKYGADVAGYLTGIQEMSRAGFKGAHAEELAELSTLAQSAGDMTADLANDYLLASNAAFKLQGNTKALNDILDGQNKITDRNAVNMTELAEATKLVASQASSSGMSVDQMTAAVGTMIATTKQGGNVAGRALKAILMNLQQVAVSKRRTYGNVCRTQ